MPHGCGHLFPAFCSALSGWRRRESFAHRLWIWRQFCGSLHNSWVPVEDTFILESLEEQKAKLGITRRVPVYCNPGISSPMLAGVWKPCIVLPEAKPIEGSTDYILLHELVHFKRHDLPL